jgi:hypothetical protein
LGVLAQANYVHRDLRLENCSCSIDRARYFLLDLETCAPANAAATTIRMKHWTAYTLCNGAYTPASDLYELGRVLLATGAAADVGPVGRSFLELLAVPAAQQQQQAAEFLQHSWIRCPGVTCNAAGAQPLER